MPPKQRGTPLADEGTLLSPRARLLTILGMSVTIAAMIAGLLGVLVLLDASNDKGAERRFEWVSNTEFGALWRKMTEKNPFFTTVFVNGGLVATIYFGRKLVDHRKAQAAEARRKKAVQGKKKD